MNLWSIIGISVLQTAHGDRDRDFVLAIWRHGKRSPMVFQKAFGDNFELWPDGAGQLTELGVKIHQGKSNFTKTPIESQSFRVGEFPSRSLQQSYFAKLSPRRTLYSKHRSRSNFAISCFKFGKIL